MSSRPVLVSIKSEWKEIVDEPVVGKDVLELLSSSMYVNPLSIYREYVQNSADAIEEAAGLGLLSGTEKGRIDITIEGRNVRIRDNGTGIAKSAFVKVMVALGASRKRGSKARGFRGVGRLAGLGYCQRLIFRSRVDGEKEISEIAWDCRRLRASLRDAAFSGSVETLIKDVVRERRYIAPNYPARFFEVELEEIIRHGDDILISPELIEEYLSQVAPVPFAPEFSFSERIEAVLRKLLNLGNVLIYMNPSQTPIYRPFRDAFEARKGVSDVFSDLQFVELPGEGSSPLAVGWILHHGYLGSIARKTLIGGLRLRCGNIQVGESEILDDLFAEHRFNSWTVGEIHVLDPRILPNGRRDHFEQSVHFNDLRNKLSPHAKELSRLCRVSSIRRNTIRQFDNSHEHLTRDLSVLAQRALSRDDQKRLQREITRRLKQMEKLCEHRVLTVSEKKSMFAKLRRTRRNVDDVLQGHDAAGALRFMRGRERETCQRVFALIYECSINKQAAKLLIDRIMSKL